MHEKKYLKCYIFMVLLYGMLLIYFIPAMQSPDENTHFYNSYAISTGDIFADVAEDGKKIGRSYPKGIGGWVDYYQNYLSDESNSHKIEQLWTETRTEQGEEELEFREYWNADTNPIAYIGPIMGMWFVRHINLVPVTPYNMLIAGRIMNLLIFLLISTLAIQITPIMKKTMMMLLLMPQTLSLAASLNYDALLLPTVFLLFALIMALNCQERKIKNWEIITFFLISIVLLCVKQAYFPLLLVALFIPFSRFLSKKQYSGIIIGCIFTAGIVYLAYKIPSDNRLDAVKAISTDYLGQKMQIQYVLSHVFVIPSIIINSIKQFSNFYMNSFFGNLGNLDILYMPLYVVMYFILLTLVILQDIKIEYKISAKMKIVSLLAVLITVVLIFIGTYIIWTNLTVGIGADYVDGVQGRYFIMCVPFIVLAFCHHSSPKCTWIKKASDFIVSRTNVELFEVCMVYLNVCLICAIVQVLLKYWV